MVRFDGFAAPAADPASPHGGLRPVHQNSTCLAESTFGLYMVQTWSRNTPQSRGNETRVLHRVARRNQPAFWSKGPHPASDLNYILRNWTLRPEFVGEDYKLPQRPQSPAVPSQTDNLCHFFPADTRSTICTRPSCLTNQFLRAAIRT